jgi:hypothetical protein
MPQPSPTHLRYTHHHPHPHSLTGAQVCECLILFLGQNEEEFSKFLQTFVEAVWTQLLKVSQAPGQVGRGRAWVEGWAWAAGSPMETPPVCTAQRPALTPPQPLSSCNACACLHLRWRPTELLSASSSSSPSLSLYCTQQYAQENTFAPTTNTWAAPSPSPIPLPPPLPLPLPRRTTSPCMPSTSSRQWPRACTTRCSRTRRPSARSARASSSQAFACARTWCGGGGGGAGKIGWVGGGQGHGAGAGGEQRACITTLHALHGLLLGGSGGCSHALCQGVQG